jgi:cyanate permease
LVGPPIIGVIKQETGSFTAALLFIAGALVLGAVVVVVFGYAQRARTVTPHAMTR